ncbi:MAG: GyrI-like domain-containing protein [candidate division WOR-3 bacterium]|nr:MAG: GyrI-like domain-containing protein [candidate division WOR-3 bacterium]
MKARAVCVAAALLLFAVTAQAGEDRSSCTPEPQSGGGWQVGTGMEVDVSMIEAMTAASILKVGPYDKVGETMDELLQWVQDKGVEVTGPAFGVYYDNPETTPPESTRFEFGVPVPEGTGGDDEAGVQVKTWGSRLAAKALFTGPYDQVGPTYGALGQWIQQNGYRMAGPTIEVYLNDPNQVPPESLQTRVCFIVEKSEPSAEQ